MVKRGCSRIKTDCYTSPQSPAIKTDCYTSAQSPAIETDCHTSPQCPTIKTDYYTSAQSPAIKTDCYTSAQSPAVKTDVKPQHKVPHGPWLVCHWMSTLCTRHRVRPPPTFSMLMFSVVTSPRVKDGSEFSLKKKKNVTRYGKQGKNVTRYGKQGKNVPLYGK